MKNSKLVFDLLGISSDVPLTEEEMAKELTVTFLPPNENTPRLNDFASKLKSALNALGAKIIPYEEALLPDEEKVRSGIVLVEQGESKGNELAIKQVSSLYHNPIVLLTEGPPPIPKNPTLQETLDSIIGVLAWNVSHVPIFLEESKWTICTMNGAVIECEDPENPEEDILHSLVPKLSAQVVPPKREEIVYREGVLDTINDGYEDHVNDFMEGAKIWRENGLMLAHTSIDDLKYRSRYHKRIVSRYLDHRTGMSYGFMVRQLPTEVEPAVEASDAPDKLRDAEWGGKPFCRLGDDTYARIQLFDREWFVKIPDVWLLSTRSGCNKTNLNPERDILRLGLQNQNIILETPGKTKASECRPSYDTYAILAHALGNVITASMLLASDQNSDFPEILRNNGLSISHWHGYPDEEYPLSGYMFHGLSNPPVSCSTPQSAAYAYTGKLKKLERVWDQINGYRGDVHIEPHHGTNITGTMSLKETARWVDKMHKNEMAKAAP